MQTKIYRNLLLFTALNLAAASLQANETVYVSPRGNDNGTGTQQSPFYSLQQAVKGRLSAGFSNDTLFVRVAPGTYILERPFTIDEPTARPVVIKADNETEKPLLLGGIRIRGWQKYDDKLYRVPIPQVLQYGFRFEQFYVNGKRATLARTPNTDWYEVRGMKEQPFVSGVRAPAYAVQRINFNPEDWATLQKYPKSTLQQLKFRFYHKWDITHKRADYIAPDSAFIYVRGNGMKPWNPVKKGSRYIMYDYRGALDEPGEWYLDREEGYLYYMPRRGEDMETAECYAPALSQWIVLRGRPNGTISNIRFENLAFGFTSYLMPEQGEEPMQAAATTRAAIEMEHARHITLSHCDLQHTGGYAIWIKRGCRSNNVLHCYLADLGAGGIKIGESWFPRDTTLVSRNNTIDNNIITHAGIELPCGVGVAILHASDNRVTHNEISDLRYSGVSVGWVWGYNHSPALWTNALGRDSNITDLQAELVSPAVRNIISYNHIHHIGWGELSDMGAVYTLGESPGTKVTHNVIHDVLSYDYGGWGLYTDEGSTGVEMTNNLVYRCKSGGFHQHYGRDNKIENNIFAFGFYYQAQYTRVEPHRSFSFRHNIILQDGGATLAGPWEKGNIDMDYNLYWHTGGTPRFGQLTPGEWKKKKEPHSIIADPLFADPQSGNYRLTSEKQTRKIGFKPFDYTLAGVYGSEEWKKKAQLTPETEAAFRQAAAVRLNK